MGKLERIKKARRISIPTFVAAVLITYCLWRFPIFYRWNAFLIGDRLGAFGPCSITWADVVTPCYRNLALLIANAGIYRGSEDSYIDLAALYAPSSPPIGVKPTCTRQNVLHLGNQGTALLLGNRRQVYLLQPVSKSDPAAFARAVNLKSGSQVELCVYPLRKADDYQYNFYQLRVAGRIVQVF